MRQSAADAFAGRAFQSKDALHAVSELMREGVT